MNGLLTLGDAATPGDIFDSVPLRGLLLASVEEMYPDSLRGYSPVVRGIARSNAEVIVRQNGVVIDQRYVPPGAFEISDLYAVSGSGDLDVTIKRATARNSACWCRLPRCRCCSAKGGSATAAAGQYRAPDASADDEVYAGHADLRFAAWHHAIWRRAVGQSLPLPRDRRRAKPWPRRCALVGRDAKLGQTAGGGRSEERAARQNVALAL